NYYARVGFVLKIPAESMLNLVTLGRPTRTEYDDFQLDKTYTWGEVKSLTQHLPLETPVVFPTVSNLRLALPTNKSGFGYASKILEEEEELTTLAQLHQLPRSSDEEAFFLAQVPDVTVHSVEPFHKTYCRGLSLYPDRVEVVILNHNPSHILGKQE